MTAPFLLTASLVFALQGPAIPLPPPRQPLAITNVTVIDVASGRRIRDQTVLVQGNRIVTVGSAASLRVPPGHTVVDGRHRFLVPGLWDMHVHASWPSFAAAFGALYIANGVTGVREMFGAIEDVRQWRTRVDAGELVAPRMIGAGHLVDGQPPIWPGSVVARTAAEGKRAVDSLATAGADFIKVYNRLTLDSYRGILEAARTHGLPVAGHVPDAVSVWEATTLGQRSIEHLSGVALGCSGDEAATRLLLDSAATVGAATPAGAALRLRATTAARESFSPARCDSLAAAFIRNDTWQVPTLIVSRSISSLRDSTLGADARLRYMAPMLVSGWDWRKDFRFRTMSEPGWAELYASYRHGLRLTALMHRAGTPILAGTDAPNPYVFPGFSLHEELALLVEAGLTPLAALQSATRNPARYFAASDSLGSVAAGHVADLVLLDADPLLDIRNTARIHAVVASGRLYRRADLDALLLFAERTANAGGPGGSPTN